jgi:hypothetical protein
MLSYDWGCQQSVLLIKNELQKAGSYTLFHPSSMIEGLYHLLFLKKQMLMIEGLYHLLFLKGRC